MKRNRDSKKAEEVLSELTEAARTGKGNLLELAIKVRDNLIE